jgi:hypothetical protein
MRLPEIKINWKPEGRKKTMSSPMKLERWDMRVYRQPWVKEVSEWANGTIEGNGICKSEGVARRFKNPQWMYVCMYVRTYVCMYVCTYVCIMYVCMYIYIQFRYYKNGSIAVKRTYTFVVIFYPFNL